MTQLKNTKIRNSILLILTALIWGIAFVAQSEGGDAVGPYSFNSIRNLIGAFVLIPVILYMDQKEKRNQGQDLDEEEKRKARRLVLIAGISSGAVLFIASNLQQMGLFMGISAGKSGFLTATYILIVPILSLFLKKKCGWNIWVGVVIALVGLYLLCMSGAGFTLEIGDVLTLLCAFFFSIQIMVVDYFAPKVNGVKMACIQFFTCAILSAIPMYIRDMGHSIEGIKIWAANFSGVGIWIAILYAGVLSCGVAYTLQIIGQKGLNPTIAALLMSLESVFSVIAGALLLSERLNQRELLGCAFLFLAIILAQIPFQKLKKKSALI